MIISQEAIRKILGIEKPVSVSAQEMAKKLKITFFPYDPDKLSDEVKSFAKKLEATLYFLTTYLVYAQPRACFARFFVTLHSLFAAASL